jgi:hypothetical protein
MTFNRFGAAEMIAGVVVASAVCGNVAAEPGARRRTPTTAPSRIVGVAGLDW